MFLLDTNVISELRRAGEGKAHPAVDAWLREQIVSDLHISVITLFECELGARLFERRNPAQGSGLRRRLDQIFLRSFGNRILPVTMEVSQRAVDNHIPDPASTHDSWIAATAFVHGLTVVTRIVKDFERTGVALFNPWGD